MDRFEQHIRKHTELFETHRADRDKLWNAISQELDNDKNVRMMFPKWSFGWRIAASLLVLVGCSVFFVLHNGFGEVPNDLESSELREIDGYYQGLVDYQTHLIMEHQGLSKTIKDEFLKSLEVLDDEYEKLRAELQINLDNQRVIAAIIQLYKKKIELMEKLLDQMEEQDQKLKKDEGYVL
ncbi:hypothetical protein [Flagellimonas aequoris]|uniref:Anti-sigma factor n=1 Tax=Flagellimonas aequoris TaxID=2306997 RepID=A0A418N872_9FLAO|nr:hypothetical protein [Allomuricauda aequoris]RIV71553.1 hypothetical protein D2U88_07245 [Allomuricauda aequoris]TXK03118.1 hypothetical protein FQ019_07190 [Allomuricauda aequoris]